MAVPPGVVTPYDELRDSAGNTRPHWRPYFTQLESIGTAEAKARWTKAKQLLAENGASYNVYGDTQGTEHPFRISPIPLVIGPQDWQQITRGMAQRARLLSCLLADLHGPQRTIAEGDLPCELLFENPRFLRALHGISVHRSNWLPLYGVDLVRAPNGQFHALEDHVQAPAGMGYAIENRLIIAQVMSDVLHGCNVERLVPFVQLLRDRFQAMAPHNRDAPRVALLTPGPFSATYFEQAFLSKYLGLPLVQGEDLVVRDTRVYLKTLGGLLPVDVLIRRVFDEFCDPLELRPDSALGVPGLVQAIRSGNVCTLNPLGTGLVESPALLAYLPGLCRRLLKEELYLPSVPTYYCGNPSQLHQALDDFDLMVIKPTHPVGHGTAKFVSRLSQAERDALRQQILDSPRDFVAQRFIPSSRTPVIANGELQSRAFILRCFASSDQPNDFQIMPGGLGFVAPGDSDFAVSMHHGARSKDVWVVSDEPVVERVLSPLPLRTIELSRGGSDLPSRVADNLYWLGRYAERTEATSRLARVVGSRLLDWSGERATGRIAELSRLLATLERMTLCLYSSEPIIEGLDNRLRGEALFVASVTDSNRPGSIARSIQSVLRVSRVVRDRISHDTWRTLATLDELKEQLLNVGKSAGSSGLVNELSQVVLTLAGFSGLVMDSMTRGFAWRFLDMGRRIERAIALVSLLRVTLVDECLNEGPLVEAVLDVADSSMTYRRRYLANLYTSPAVDLLLADDTNPRSVLFQLKTLSEHIDALPPLSTPGVRSMQQKLMLSLTSQVELSDVNELCALDEKSGQRQNMRSLLDRLGKALPALSDSLTETYLYHANVARNLVQTDSTHEITSEQGRLR